MTTLAVGGLLAAAVPRQPTMHMCFGSREDIARTTVFQYADEALRAWHASTSSYGCPAELEALNPWMNNKDIRDPWGREYQFRCTSAVGLIPAKIVVWSVGPDQQSGTPDDIRSDR